MRLPAFGYVRVPAGPPECATQGPRKELAEYADREGYVLSEIFTEHAESGSSAFAALVDALKDSEQPVVIVPALCHFAHLPALRSAMKKHVEQETGARIVIIHDAEHQRYDCGRLIPGMEITQ